MAFNTDPSTTRQAVVPLLPRTGGGNEDPEALRAVRRFHLEPALEPPGEDGPGGDRPWPALLAPLANLDRVRTDEPFVVVPREDGETRVHLLPDWLRRWLPAGEAPMLAELLPHLEQRVRRSAEDGEAPRPARPAFEAALKGLGEALDLVAAGRERLTAEVEAALARLPGDARLVTLGSGTALELLLLTLNHRRPVEQETLIAEVTHGAQALASMLGDDGAEAMEPGERLSAQLGSAGDLLNATALASRLGSRRSKSFEPEARATLERDLEVLEGFPQILREGAGVTVVVQKGAAGAAAGTATVEAGDPFAEAARRWDAAADQLAGALRSLRRVELALRGEWRPRRHDPWLKRLDRRALTPRERILVPPVLVVADGAGAVRSHLASLTRLLLSDRPVQVLLTVDPATDPVLLPRGDEAEGEDGPIEDHRFEVGLYGLGLEHPFVQQGTAARPLALVEGFRQALAGARPGLHVVAEGPSSAAGETEETGGGPFWRTAGAALESRAHPSFRWDPVAGERWTHRFNLEGNPAPEADWPTGTVACMGPEGRQESLEVAFTFADFALLDPAWRGHVRPLPDGVAEGEVVAVTEALAIPEDELRRLPFLWVVVGLPDEPRLERWVISRPLLRACRDRRDTWHDLQERAGVGSPYVWKAAALVDERWEERWAAERRALEEQHARELEDVRRRAGEEALDRLATALLAGPLMVGAEPVRSAAPPPAAPVPGVPGPGASEGEPSDALAERLISRLEDGSASPATSNGGALSPRAEALAERLLARLGDGAGMAEVE